MHICVYKTQRICFCDLHNKSKQIASLCRYCNGSAGRKCLGCLERLDPICHELNVSVGRYAPRLGVRVGQCMCRQAQRHRDRTVAKVANRDQPASVIMWLHEGSGLDVVHSSAFVCCHSNNANERLVFPPPVPETKCNKH